MSLENDLKKSSPCTIDVQCIGSDQGNFFVIFFRNKEGEAIGHWITQDDATLDGLASAIGKFKETKDKKIQ